MPALPTLAALEKRLGLDADSLDGPDKVRAEVALEDATALVFAEAPWKAQAWSTDCPAVVAVVILKAARREYENPEGYVSTGVGEVSGTVKDATGAYLTPAEEAIVRRAATGRRGGFVGTIRTPSAYEADS